MNVFLTRESHVWKSLKGSLSLVFGDKVGEEGTHQTKHNSNVVKEANLAEDTFEMGKFWFWKKSCKQKPTKGMKSGMRSIGEIR